VVVFSPDGTRLASVSKDQTARIWDVTSGKQIQVISLSSSSTPFSIAFSPNGRMIATGGSDGVVRLIPLATDDLLALAHARVSRQHLTDDECKVYLHQQAGCTP
jgi:WD40 repeat protein